MALPTFTMRELLEAGVHFGHTTRRWNPKMRPYIFGKRNGVHILDLEQTVPLLHQAITFVRDVVAGGGRVLFVGTKRQASDKVAEAAKRCGQYYVNHRWLGGMLTNWKTISQSIKRLREAEAKLAGETEGLTKKELLNLTRERDKLERALGGIKEMGGLPTVLFIIDTNKEHIAVEEAKVLGIPVVAVLDSNSDPDGIGYAIPGNDDAIRAITLYCDLVSEAVLDGIQAEVAASGKDVGEADVTPAETLPASKKADAETTPAKSSAETTPAKPNAETAPAKPSAEPAPVAEVVEAAAAPAAKEAAPQ
jgi:small subunit ribosomal protein S2